MAYQCVHGLKMWVSHSFGVNQPLPLNGGTYPLGFELFIISSILCITPQIGGSVERRRLLPPLEMRYTGCSRSEQDALYIMMPPEL